jgi:hypothetical protein
VTRCRRFIAKPACSPVPALEEAMPNAVIEAMACGLAGDHHSDGVRES